VETLGSPGDAVGLCHLNERPDMPEVHGAGILYQTYGSSRKDVLDTWGQWRPSVTVRAQS
jgi:hypothetical protein